MDATTLNQITASLAELQAQINKITDTIKAATVTVSPTSPVKTTDVFPATLFEMKFPVGKKGTIAYQNGSGVYRKYTLSFEDVAMSPNGKMEDIMTQIIEKTDVELVNKGLVYKNVHPEGEVYFTPVLNQVYPARQYKVYYGNPYNPQGQIVYFDQNNASKAVTKFGLSDVLTITKFTQITNCKLVAI